MVKNSLPKAGNAREEGSVTGLGRSCEGKKCNHSSILAENSMNRGTR